MTASAPGVKGPVNVLIHMAYDLAKNTTDPQVKAMATNLDKGLHELNDLLSEIIVMARITTNISTPTAEIIHMGQLGDAFEDQLEPLAYNHDVVLAIDDAQYAVKSNMWLLRRIIYNLLTNAIVHTNKGTKVRLWLKRRDQFCIISIVDTGPGIPNAYGRDHAANFANLLKVQHRSDKPNKAEGVSTQSGHGLGLLGVMRMCNTLGITMTLVSKVGKGTMFRFKVPLADQADLARMALPKPDEFDLASKE